MKKLTERMMAPETVFAIWDVNGDNVPDLVCHFYTGSYRMTRLECCAERQSMASGFREQTQSGSSITRDT